MKRTEIIRGLVAGWMGSGMDLSTFETEEDIAAAQRKEIHDQAIETLSWEGAGEIRFAEEGTEVPASVQDWGQPILLGLPTGQPVLRRSEESTWQG
jgi:hypothetical protein